MKPLRFTDKQIPCAPCDRCGHLWLSGPIAYKYKDLVYDPEPECYGAEKGVQKGLYYPEYRNIERNYSSYGGSYEYEGVPWKNKSKLCIFCICFLNKKYECAKERFFNNEQPKCHDCDPHKYRNPKNRFYCASHNKGCRKMCFDCGINEVSQFYDISCQSCKDMHYLRFFTDFIGNVKHKEEKKEEKNAKNKKGQDVQERFKDLRHHQKRIIYPYYRALETTISTYTSDDLARMIISFF